MPTKFQFLMRFTKDGKARFLSHRELLNLIEQAIRRAGVPIVFSEGFNPRPRISFPTALPLGVSSGSEIMYFQLSEWMSQNEIAQKINKGLIEGITVVSIEPLRQDSIVSFSVEYQITPLTENASQVVSQLSPDKLREWMSQPAHMIQRDYANKESKMVNLKSYVQKVELKDGSLHLSIRITNEGTARPEEVLCSLGVKGTAKDGSFSIRKLETVI